MSRKLSLLSAALMFVALAACGKDDEEKGAASTQPAPPQSEAVAPTIDQSGGEAGPDLLKALHESSGILTPEEKAAAIERARVNAVTAAKAVGQSDEQAQQAGEAAMAAAQRSFESREAQ